MRCLARALFAAIAPVLLSCCALLVSFSGLDDGGASDADVEMDSASDAPDRSLPGVGDGADGALADAAIDYLGCYADDGTNRDLPYGAYASIDNSVEACVTACAYHGYSYAGLQDGIQCFCGDRYGGYGPSTNCTTPCPGKASETCGGPYANSVYRTPIRPDAGTD